MILDRMSRAAATRTKRASLLLLISCGLGLPIVARGDTLLAQVATSPRTADSTTRKVLNGPGHFIGCNADQGTERCKSKLATWRIPDDEAPSMSICAYELEVKVINGVCDHEVAPGRRFVWAHCWAEAPGLFSGGGHADANLYRIHIADSIEPGCRTPRAPPGGWWDPEMPEKFIGCDKFGQTYCSSQDRNGKSTGIPYTPCNSLHSCP